MLWLAVVQSFKPASTPFRGQSDSHFLLPGREVLSAGMNWAVWTSSPYALVDDLAHPCLIRSMNITEAPETADSCPTCPVTPRYQPPACPTDEDGRNLDRVRLLMRLFGLTISEVAKAGGVSRPYLSRALGGSLIPSPVFWRRLEGNLGSLVDQRGSQFFSIPGTAYEGGLAEGQGG